MEITSTSATLPIQEYEGLKDTEQLYADLISIGIPEVGYVELARDHYQPRYCRGFGPGYTNGRPSIPDSREYYRAYHTSVVEGGRTKWQYTVDSRNALVPVVKGLVIEQQIMANDLIDAKVEASLDKKRIEKLVGEVDEFRLMFKNSKNDLDGYKTINKVLIGVLVVVVGAVLFNI